MKTCFATIKNTGERLQLLKGEGSRNIYNELDFGPLFWHGNRCWWELELVDIIYEDDPRYPAEIEAVASHQNDWRKRKIHYSMR